MVVLTGSVRCFLRVVDYELIDKSVIIVLYFGSSVVSPYMIKGVAPEPPPGGSAPEPSQ